MANVLSGIVRRGAARVKRSGAGAEPATVIMEFSRGTEHGLPDDKMERLYRRDALGLRLDEALGLLWTAREPTSPS